MLPVIRRFRDWDEPLSLYKRDWDRWFDQMMSEENWVSGYPVDIREDDGKILVEAEMPGFRKEDIQIDVEENLLRIHAERKEEAKKGKQHLSERRFSRVERQFRLPSHVDVAKVQAKLDDGVLFLVMPKAESPKVKQIEIK